ncbi:YktB family protein [Metabacillus arenae]|uniref:UPF0637 protein IC621_11780 n=1 Tax=Metabacillus arenae TaxID=2771434 RepID=A0A926RY78_9BACI|nr:DUF1054 domain-containing protein [Metabacillus arenae]MBD1380912.1 DUF1054 domain-containing protein [Metabacillus arenae]
MGFKGFKQKDFNVFKINGLDERMEALIERVRPKLEELGEHFAPTLSAATGEEMFPHVAKHARRSVNPPDDSWVAFANNKRGYKKHPHFQIGLWETHVFVWFAIIYESPIKEEYGKELKKEWGNIKGQIPSDFVWSIDHTVPDAVKQSDLSKEDFDKMFERLQTVKKAELLCGINIPRDDVKKMTGKQFIQKVEDTFQTLLPLYKLAQKAAVSS